MRLTKWFPHPLILLFVLIVVIFPWPGLAQQTRPDQEITKLADNVYLFRHRFHQSIFIVTPQGVIATDPIGPEAATWLKGEIGKLTDKPVRYLIYSHDHADHISGGTVFADTATVVSHWRARHDILLEKRPQTPVPELTFTDRLFIDLGGIHLELIYVGRNHSDNSIVMLLPQHKLLFAVDFIPVEGVAYRTMLDSYPEDWIESLKQVEQLEFETLVPGHGKIGRKEHVRMFREYLEELMEAVRQAIVKGMSLEEAKKTLRLPKYEQWRGYPDWFIENIEAIYNDITRHRIPNP